MLIGSELVGSSVHFLLFFRKKTKVEKLLFLNYPESNRATDTETKRDWELSNFGKEARIKFRRKTRSIFLWEFHCWIWLTHGCQATEYFGESTINRTWVSNIFGETKLTKGFWRKISLFKAELSKCKISNLRFSVKFLFGSIFQFFR